MKGHFDLKKETYSVQIISIAFLPITNPPRCDNIAKLKGSDF